MEVWKEYAQNAMKKKNLQNSILEGQTPEDVKSAEVRTQELEEQKTQKNSEMQLENGMNETQKKENKSPQTRTENEDKNFWICTEENVNVAEKKLSNSLPLNTYWEMDTKIEKNTELGICTSSQSKSTDQIDMKSSATTVIMQDEDTDNVPICVGFSEIDKYAIKIYEQHFPTHRNFWDITKINTDELPDFDCLVWGFPCQAFSIAWKRKWFEDTRGTLFFELARILRAKQPRLFVFENVKGLLSHDNGKTFSTIIATIDELGYDCQWQVLNSKNHWVPQNRERVFIIWHLRGTPRPQVFPLWLSDEEHFWEADEQRCESTLTWQSAWGGQPVIRVPEATRQWFSHAGWGDSINLSNPNSKTRRGRVGRWVGRWVAQTLYTQMQQYTLEWMRQPKIYDDYNQKWRKDDVTCTLTPNTGSQSNRNGQKVYDTIRIRRLTPTECERLQWFPDWWTEWVSDTQRYKCLGNAVTVNVISDIFSCFTL